MASRLRAGFGARSWREIWVIRKIAAFCAILAFFGGSSAGTGVEKGGESRMASRDEIRELIVKSFVDIVRCNERNLPLRDQDLMLLESHLNWELAPESVERWASEMNISGEDLKFYQEMFQHCYEHFTEDLKELKEAVGEDPSLER